MSCRCDPSCNSSTFPEAVSNVDISSSTIVNSTLQGCSISGSTIEGISPPVTSVAALRALDTSGFSDGSVVEVLGYYLPGDGGGGAFYLDSGSVAAEDNGLVIKPTASAGRWMRRFSGPINIRWFGAKGDGSTDDYDAIVDAVDVAKPLGATLFFPRGTYCIRTNFPVRQDGTVSSLVDYNGLTLSGEGRNSIIKTTYPGGADVLQLNGVKNFRAELLGFASEISGAGSGSNAVSVTGGADNITIERCHAYEMPFVDDGVSTDGGQAFTIQTGETLVDVKNVRFVGNTADGGSYGVNLQFAGSGVLVNPPQGIEAVGNRLHNFYRGINVECSATGATTAAIEGMSGLIALNTTSQCAQDLRINGVTGWDVVGHVGSSTFGAGSSGQVTFDALKFALLVLSSHRCTVSSSKFYKANSDFFALVGGGWAGESNTPTDRFNLVSCGFFGSTDSYGVKCSVTEVYGYVTNCNFIGNTFEDTTSGEYDPSFRRENLGNSIIGASGSVFTQIIGATCVGGRELITGWTNGSTPFGTLTVNANGHDISSLVASGTGKFAGAQVNLTVGRRYMVEVTASAANLGLYTNDINDTGGTFPNGSVSGAILSAGVAQTIFFEADTNDNWLIIKSLGAFTGSVNISLKEVPLSVSGPAYFDGPIRATLREFASNIDAINGGLQAGDFYHDGADPAKVCVVLPL